MVFSDFKAFAAILCGEARKEKVEEFSHEIEPVLY